MNLNTPVALFIFKRPESTQRVFNAIREARPTKLLVIADGPRFPEQLEQCHKAREVIHQVDWDCQVLTDFSDVNLGCRQRVSTGLDWVFSEVEEAIILEDDCLPTQSFFYFCQTLLDFYRNDHKISHISGNNFQNGQKRTEYSYYFSKYIHIFGWATWRRAWKFYDVDIKTWPDLKKSKAIKLIGSDIYEQKYWTDIFNKTYEGKIDTWDYQWLYTCWVQNDLSIYPNANLVSNIGFGLNALHTKDVNDHLANVPTNDIWEIEHPPFVIRNEEADIYTFDYVFGGNKMKNNDTLLKRITRQLLKFKNQ